MPSELAWREKALLKRAEARCFSEAVDFGIRLTVVDQDLEGGVEVVSGCPPVRELRSHLFGGFVDTRRRRLLCRADSDDYRKRGGKPVQWYCGPRHERLILHPDDMPLGILVCGGEGAGKTRGALAPWLVLRSLEALESGILETRELSGGCTAPINKRREHVLRALRELCRPEWARWKDDKDQWQFCFGFDLDVLSTHKNSEKEGSRIQGYNWLFCGSDEGQDQDDEVDGDIEARGRSAPDGRFKRLVTASQKDSSRWRKWRDSLKRDPGWLVEIIPGPENPFVSPAHWERMRRLDEHEYQRRVLAKDVRSPLAIYYPFDRDLHVVPPDRFARDVTPDVLRGYAPHGVSYDMLIGHDPGIVFNTSVLLRAVASRRILTWYVVGEFVTQRTTQDMHAAALRMHLQERYGLNHDRDRHDPDIGMRQAVVICDPHGRGEKSPDEDEYHAFRRNDVAIFSADPKSKQIKKRARVGMINRLLKAANGTTRLYILKGDDGQPVAPRLVASIEDAALDKFGRIDSVKKDETDNTHPSTALGYALYPFERELRTDWTHLMAGGLQ